MAETMAWNVWKQRYVSEQFAGKRVVYDRRDGSLIGECVRKPDARNHDDQGWDVYRGGVYICTRRVMREAMIAVTEAEPDG